MNNVTITISIAGAVGTGKTTLCQLISETLETWDFDVVVLDEDKSTFDKLTLRDKVKSLILSGTAITIQTVQTNRESFEKK